MCKCISFGMLRNAVSTSQLLSLSTCASAYRVAQRPAIDMAATAGAQEVILEHRGSAAIVTLNRPKALNALNTNMVERMLPLYTEWNRSEGGPKLVILKGAGGKAFCAGGDVRSIVELGQAGNVQEARKFFETEYRLNFALSQLRKPHVALIHGVTMGGGVGVSVHGAFRVATEKTLFAMPELGIGLFPDVGASYFLPRLPGELGMYLALSNVRLKGAQVKEAGIATHYVQSSSLPELEEALCKLGEVALDHSAVDAELRRFEDSSHASEGEAHRPGILEMLPAINHTFGQPTLSKVVDSLEQQTNGQNVWARDTLEAMRKGSPLSAHVTFEQLRRGRHMSIAECLEMEYGMACSFVQGNTDFAEGVRAVLIDKDNAPQWRHSDLSQVTAEEVQEVFEALPDEERLGLDGSSPGLLPRAALPRL